MPDEPAKGERAKSEGARSPRPTGPFGPAPPEPPDPFPQPGDFRRALFRLAATKHPPAGAGLVALSGWTLWVAHLVRPSLRDWFYGAAGLFLIAAIMYNRIQAEGRREIDRHRRRHTHADRHEEP